MLAEDTAEGTSAVTSSCARPVGRLCPEHFGQPNATAARAPASVSPALRAAGELEPREVFPFGERLLIRACGDGTRDNGSKVEQGRFRLDVREVSLPAAQGLQLDNPQGPFQLKPFYEVPVVGTGIAEATGGAVPPPLYPTFNKTLGVPCSQCPLLSQHPGHPGHSAASAPSCPPEPVSLSPQIPFPAQAIPVLLTLMPQPTEPHTLQPPLPPPPQPPRTHPLGMKHAPGGGPALLSPIGLRLGRAGTEQHLAQLLPQKESGAQDTDAHPFLGGTALLATGRCYPNPTGTLSPCTLHLDTVQ